LLLLQGKEDDPEEVVVDEDGNVVEVEAIEE
jgi:hypothetical protein